MDKCFSKCFPRVVAVKLASMHVTSCASERNLSKFGRLYVKLRGRLRIEAADKIFLVAQNRQSMLCEGTEEEDLLECIKEHVTADANSEQQYEEEFEVVIQTLQHAGMQCRVHASEF
jgi:hypothetical protein